MIRALIFDFDGLILDTETPEYQVWQAVYREHGLELTLAVWAGWLGGDGDSVYNPYDDLERRLGHPLDREALRQRALQSSLALVAAQPVLPGVESYLAEAKRLGGLGLAIASSSPRDWVDGHLSRLGLLAHFDAIKTAEDVERTKPDPALFLAALDALGARPEEAIVLEDSPNGVLAAKRAGIFCVAVPNPLTRQLALDHADLRLDSLADLPLETLLALARRPGES